MQRYGLIGKKLGHSFSPAYFHQKFKELGIQAVYDLFEMDKAEDLSQLVRDHSDLLGLNVTVPFKKDVLPILDHIDPQAQAVGAVNTIKIETEGNRRVLSGFNTDIIGFQLSLQKILGEKSIPKALVLGTGGASKAVIYVLKSMGISFLVVSRNPVGSDQLSYTMLNKQIIDECRLIVNTTPLGMFPETSRAPEIPYQYLSGHHVLYDLVYNPAETLFMKYGRQKEAVVSNGLEMLRLQAEASWKIWND